MECLFGWIIVHSNVPFRSTHFLIAGKCDCLYQAMYISILMSKPDNRHFNNHSNYKVLTVINGLDVGLYKTIRDKHYDNVYKPKTKQCFGIQHSIYLYTNWK